MIYLKVVIVGDGGIGKTAMVLRYTKNTFSEDYKVTIGVQFATQVEEVDGETVKLQIWDTAGEERFSFLMPIYYRGAQGAILVFDVSRRESFQNISNWTEELLEHSEKIPIALVANKIDLRTKSDDPVSTKEGESLSKVISYQTGFKSPFIEASALFEQKNLEPFLNIARVLLSQYQK